MKSLHIYLIGSIILLGISSSCKSLKHFKYLDNVITIDKAKFKEAYSNINSSEFDERAIIYRDRIINILKESHKQYEDKYTKEKNKYRFLTTVGSVSGGIGLGTAAFTENEKSELKITATTAFITSTFLGLLTATDAKDEARDYRSCKLYMEKAQIEIYASWSNEHIHVYFDETKGIDTLRDKWDMFHNNLMAVVKNTPRECR